MNRRSFILSSLGLVLVSRPALAAKTNMIVYKSPTCGCCSAWVEHMRDAGFSIDARNIDQNTLWSIKMQAGITPDLASCHTALVDDYIVEGHVPASDVQRLLAERPDAIGLAVPGMPIGSPGMEVENQREAFDTLLLLGNSRTEIFTRHS